MQDLLKYNNKITTNIHIHIADYGRTYGVTGLLLIYLLLSETALRSGSMCALQKRS